MDEKRNRRQFARVNLHARIRVAFPGVDSRRQLLLENLSAGGLFIQTEQPKPIGTEFTFEFIARDGGPTIEGAGVVRWIESELGRPKGMGIHFLRLNEAGEKDIRELLALRK